MEFIDLKAQYQQVEDKIKVRIDQVLSHGKYIMGPEVQELEEKLADYVGVKHCISCANGTDALQLALMAMGIGPGDVVIVPPFTFFATAEAVKLVGAEPLFVDVDPETFNMCPLALERSILESEAEVKDRLKAVIVVDLFGAPADYTKISMIANEYGLAVIEDGAQGMGGSIEDKKSCSFGDISTTSFFPAKPLGCYGDGGALFTNDQEYAEQLRSLRVHGKGVDKYDNVRIGMNSRLDTIQAAILLEKLSIFDSELKSRNLVAQRYLNGLKLKEVRLPAIPSGFCSSWAQFTLTCENRMPLLDALKTADIPVGIYYPSSINKSKLFEIQSACPVSESLASRVMSLPMHPYLTTEDQDAVIQVLNEL